MYGKRYIIVGVLVSLFLAAQGLYATGCRCDIQLMGGLGFEEFKASDIQLELGQKGYTFGVLNHNLWAVYKDVCYMGFACMTKYSGFKEDTMGSDTSGFSVSMALGPCMAVKVLSIFTLYSSAGFLLGCKDIEYKEQTSSLYMVHTQSKSWLGFSYGLCVEAGLKFIVDKRLSPALGYCYTMGRCVMEDLDDITVDLREHSAYIALSINLGDL